MGYKGTIGKTNWVLGEISPRAFGQFSQEKPIYKDGAAILENMLIFQDGGIMYRPGTQYVAPIKNSANKVCLYRFTYSIAQEYVIELGQQYMRFFANSGQVIVPSAPGWQTSTGYVPGQYVTENSLIYYCLIAHTSGTFATDLSNGDWVLQNILEVPTVFQQADIFNLQTANKADVMYICNSNYPPQKLIRTSATSFTISAVPFVGGPFLDVNITATTITASADTGAGITLTASTAIFQAGHVGALFGIGKVGAFNGSVLITAFTDSTHVTGNVQPNPDGSAGNLGTSGSAVTDWAEGAFSSVRGYPAAVTFHEQRIIYGGTTYQPQTMYASQIGAYDNFNPGTAADSDAWTYEISSNVSNGIRWLYSASVGLKVGTSGGTITAADGSTSGITPSAPPNITLDTDYGVMETIPQSLDGFLMYLQNNTYQLRQLQADLILSRDKSVDMNLITDHIFRDGFGAVQIARQQSPNTRIWAVRGDGQIAVLTRNTEEKVLGWCRIVGGSSDGTVSCNGLSGGFETIAILPIDGQDDQIWVVCERLINGSFVRWMEIFTSELFQNYWEPVRVDASLSYDNPLNITTISGNTITISNHGLNNGDQVKIEGVFGFNGELNDNIYVVNNVTTNTFQIFVV